MDEPFDLLRQAIDALVQASPVQRQVLEIQF
jgi:hypothetical protein